MKQKPRDRWRNVGSMAKHEEEQGENFGENHCAPPRGIGIDADRSLRRGSRAAVESRFRRSGSPEIRHDRFGVPRAPVLKQLARALKLDIDVLYLWGRQIPPDIRAEGLSEQRIKEAWHAFRAVIKRKN